MVLQKLKGIQECDCCGMRVASSSYDGMQERDDLILCPTCFKLDDKILKQKMELKRAPINSVKTVDGSELKVAYTLGSRYDQNSIAVQTGDIQDCRITAVELLKILQKHKFNAIKSRKYFYLELQNGD